MSQKPPSAVVVTHSTPSASAPRSSRVRGHEIYLHLPNGMGRSQLPAYLGRQLKVPITVRNWNTVNKLRARRGGVT